MSTPLQHLQMQKKKPKHHLEDDNAQAQGSPTQLQFYPPLWCDVLEFAKVKFCFFLANVKSFPSLEDGIKEAADCIMEALSEC